MKIEDRKKVLEILTEVKTELMKAKNTFADFNSAHEGYAVLKEEVDELWDEIKTKKMSRFRVKKEAIQVAAMAIRIVTDCAYFVEDQSDSRPEPLPVSGPGRN